jgi:PA domain
MIAKLLARTLALGAALGFSFAMAAATITIVNNNTPGVGFNDMTPVAPVGGNPGTTLGQQRLNAFQYAASLWGAELDSSVEIQVGATFEPLSCTATSAVLGSAGPFNAWVFNVASPGIVAGRWYHAALANKLVGADIDTAVFGTNEPELTARFNSNLGAVGCFDGGGWYYGIDNNAGSKTNLVAVLLHEFAHGLGFSTLTSSLTGAQLGATFTPPDPRPSRYDDFLFDNQQGRAWNAMTNSQRAASAITPRKVAWTGANVFAAAPSVLVPSFPELSVSGPQAGAVAGSIEVGQASFGPALSAPGVTGQLMPVVDLPNGNGEACSALSAINKIAVRGNIAVVDRGTCGFAVKAKNVQLAGAIGIVVADNVAGGPPPGLGGVDATVTIPAVRITLEDGVRLKAAMATRARTTSGVVGTIGINASRLAGADVSGRPLIFTPNPRQAGSSVSHWDQSAFKNLLMEPNINTDLTQSVRPPNDLTLPMFKDIGW